MSQRLDFSWGLGHGPVAGAVNAALATVACAIGMQATHTSRWWALAGGAALAVVAASVVRNKHYRTEVRLYRMACWVGAGIWACAMQQSTPHWPASHLLHGFLWLAGGIAGAALLDGAFRTAERSKAIDAGQMPALPKPRKLSRDERRAEAVIAQWQGRDVGDEHHAGLLETVCSKPEVQVKAVEWWSDDSGYTVELQLPADGTTMDAIKNHEEGLAHALDLGTGCQVEILRSTLGRRTILARVTVKAALLEDQEMPKDLSVRSIHAPLLMGVVSDRSVASINVRFASAVMVGQKDSGKSNQLSVLLAQLMRCDDVFICVIDVTGDGRLASPLLVPFVKRQVSRPPLDYVAPNNDQALLLTKGLLNVIKRRTKAYRDVQLQEDTDKVPVSSDIPQIVLVVDEFAALAPAVKEDIRQIVDTGRGAAVSTICCALRAMVDYIPRSIISQSRERIGMRVSDEDELQNLFSRTWKMGRISPESMPSQGYGHFSTDGSNAALFKGWRIKPSALIDAAVATVHRRVDLDAASAEAWDTVTLPTVDKYGQKGTSTQTGVFTNRWDHALPEMFEGYKPKQSAPLVPSPRPEINGVEMPAASPVAVLDETTVPLTQLWSEERPDPRTRYYKMLRTGSPRLTATQIYEQLQRWNYPTNRTTVHAWLKEDLAAGRVTKSEPVGREVFYQWKGDEA